LKQGIDADGAGEVLGGPPTGGLCAVSLDVHGSQSPVRFSSCSG
jgi:hypothetical protein